MEIWISINGGLLTTGVFRGAGNSEVIYVVILRRVSIHIHGPIVGSIDLGHLCLRVLYSNSSTVGVAQKGALKRRHCLRRASDVHIFHKGHGTTSFRVQSQSAETRKAENKKTFNFYICRVVPRHNMTGKSLCALMLGPLKTEL